MYNTSFLLFCSSKDPIEISRYVGKIVFVSFDCKCGEFLICITFYLYNFSDESPQKRRQVAKKRTIPAHL